MIPIRDRLPRRHVPIVNWLLILANVVAFMWERAVLATGVSPQRFLVHFGLVPARLLAHPLDAASSVIGSMFLHDPTSVLHIGGNMLFLWIFGDNVEDALGKGRYLLFYVLSGFAAAAAQVLINPLSPVPMVGASGAIAGVLAAYVTLYPRAPVTVLNPVPLLWLFMGLFLELPAWVVILEFFALNLWNGFASLGQGSTGVAFFAHIGGFVAGLFLVRRFVKERLEELARTRAARQAQRPTYQVYVTSPTHRSWGG